MYQWRTDTSFMSRRVHGSQEWDTGPYVPYTWVGVERDTNTGPETVPPSHSSCSPNLRYSPSVFRDRLRDSGIVYGVMEDPEVSLLCLSFYFTNSQSSSTTTNLYFGVLVPGKDSYYGYSGVVGDPVTVHTPFPSLFSYSFIYLLIKVFGEDKTTGHPCDRTRSTCSCMVGNSVTSYGR